jgi:surfeit locus 1 family protein
MTHKDGPDTTNRRPLWLDLTILIVAAVVFATLVALGTWQMQRLEWKTSLIASVETRAFGEPVAIPDEQVQADTHAYLRVETAGIYRHDLSRKVKAVTGLGPGHWLMTPLETDEQAIWINRGFVPSGSTANDWVLPDGQQSVVGLLRVTEPNGTFLENNDPAAGRWVSRDVDALSKSVDLPNMAEFFIDAEHVGDQNTYPQGGLTQVKFRNTHLSYALTWYAMAALFLCGMIYVVRDRLRRGDA